METDRESEEALNESITFDFWLIQSFSETDCKCKEALHEAHTFEFDSIQLNIIKA